MFGVILTVVGVMVVVGVTALVTAAALCLGIFS